VDEHDVEVMEEIVRQMSLSASVTGNLKAVIPQSQCPFPRRGRMPGLGGLAVTVGGGRVTVE